MIDAKPGDLKIEGFTNHSTDTAVHIQIKLTAEMMAKAEAAGLQKKFKMCSTMTTSNMHLFNADGKITKYDEPTDIIEEFYPLRLQFYEKRKAALLDTMGFELKKLDNKTRFILAVCVPLAPSVCGTRLSVRPPSVCLLYTSPSPRD